MYSRETLEFTRAELLAHKKEAVAGHCVPLFSTHARTALVDPRFEDYAFFGDGTDKRQRPIDACGRYMWNEEHRILNAWYWLPHRIFRGLYLTNFANDTVPDKDFAASESFNGFSVLSTSRDTTVLFGNVVVNSLTGGLKVNIVDIPLDTEASDRLVRNHLDQILQRKIQEFIPEVITA